MKDEMNLNNTNYRVTWKIKANLPGVPI